MSELVHDNHRSFDPLSNAKIGAVAIGAPLGLVIGSKVDEALTHYPANIEVPAGQHNPYWQPTGLESAGMFVGPPLLLAAAAVAVASLVERFVHRHAR